MSEISTDIFVSNIVNGMLPALNTKQLKRLEDILYINLKDIELSNSCYDIAETLYDNDTMKLSYFEGSLRLENKSEKTIKQYIRAAKDLRNAVGLNFIDIKSKHIKFYLSNNNWTAITKRNTVNYLSAFFKYLVREEIILKNPMDKISPIHLNKIIKNPFSKVELEKIRSVCHDNPRNIALIEFLLSSGIRVGELVKLNWCDLDFQKLKFKVHGKGAKEREVLFNEKASYYLKEYGKYRSDKEQISFDELLLKPLFVGTKIDRKTKKFERIKEGGIRDILSRIGKDCDIVEISPHKFRRTFATNCIEKGMPIEQLRILMGHESIETTIQYIKIKTSTVDYTYRKLCE